MTVSIQKARALCTKPELALFKASLPKTVATLTPAVLKRDVARARNLRDKNRQLGKKQARGGKEGERTALKAQLFDEALGRFQAQLAVLEKAAKKKATRQRARTAKNPKARRSAKAKAAKSARPPGKKTVVKKKAAKKPAAKKAAAKKAATKKAATKKAAKASTKKAAARKKPLAERPRKAAAK